MGIEAVPAKREPDVCLAVGGICSEIVQTISNILRYDLVVVVNEPLVVKTWKMSSSPLIGLGSNINL